MASIEKKESYRWIASSLNTKTVLGQIKKIIIIQDREGGIYEQFCFVPDTKTHLLIRAKSNRVLYNKEKLFEYLSKESSQGTYSFELDGDKRRNIKNRTAIIEVRFSEVTISGN